MIAARIKVKFHRKPMDNNPAPSLADELASLQDWWREAGVDYGFADEAVAWLQEPKPKIEEKPALALDLAARKRPEAAPAQPIGGEAGSWPANLAEFREWWLGDASLDPGGTAARVPPRGKAGATLMVFTAFPEVEDREHLLSGPQGRLLASFLKAAGLDEAEAYFASVLPRHTPHPDWQELQARGLGQIALHHASLVRPKRILLFGNDILALFCNNPAQSAPFLLDLNHQGGSVAALPARSLEHMLNIPSARSRFWRDWLDWTNG
ncbi:MAG TPA: hypothetical protein VLA37_06450 [Sphingomonadaceae bacterium]|nr:hypothetical protein [Sphingomonadaceae bacterium]